MKNNLSLGQTLKAGLYAGLAAAAVNTLLFLVFSATGLISEQIMPQPGVPLTVAPVVIASLLPSCLAGVVYYLLARFTTSPYRYFLIISSIILLASFVNPFLVIPQVTLGYGLALDLMHLVVAASVLLFFHRVLNVQPKATA